MNAKAPPGQNKLLWSALMEGPSAGVDRLQHALAAGANPNFRRGPWTALGKALRSGSPEKALALLEAGAHPDAPEARGQPPLLQAVNGGLSLQAVALELLKRGATPTGEMLKNACRNGAAETVVALLRHGAPVVVEGNHRCDLAALDWKLDRHGPLPLELRAAIQAFDPPASPETPFGVPNERYFANLWGELARTRHRELWSDFCARPDHLARWAPDMAAAAAEALWMEGVADVVAACPSAAAIEQDRGLLGSDYPGSVVAGTVSGLARADRGPQERHAFAVLDAVLAAGFSAARPATTTGSSGTWVKIPLLIHATHLYRNSSTGRRRLLAKLIAAGADPAETWPEQASGAFGATLAHCLAERADAATWAWMRRQWPRVDWGDEAQSVLVWALDRRKKDASVEEIVRDFLEAGASPVATAPDGRTALHALALSRRGRDPSNAEDACRALVRLLRAGVPLNPDFEGREALDVLKEEGEASLWRHIMLSRTLSLPEAGPSPRRHRL